MHQLLAQRQIDDFARDGAVLVPGLFAGFVDLIAEGIEANMADPDAEGMEILEWPMQPGDALAFDFRVLHGARGNESTTRRRAFSLRLVGDDACYVDRPGPVSYTHLRAHET